MNAELVDERHDAERPSIGDELEIAHALVDLGRSTRQGGRHGPSALAADTRWRDPRGMTENERVTKLEAQITDLEAKQTELYNQLAEARLDQWKGRLEDLELQVHLGAMDSNDRIAALMHKARDRWDDARTQFGGATATAAEAFETVRGGFEAALDDVRRALLDARKQATDK